MQRRLFPTSAPRQFLHLQRCRAIRLLLRREAWWGLVEVGRVAAAVGAAIGGLGQVVELEEALAQRHPIT